MIKIRCLQNALPHVEHDARTHKENLLEVSDK